MPSPTRLTQRMMRTIQATGPISVAQYMAESNAHYYAGRDPLGAAGDFITAPEVSQMFGELVGLWLADLWMRADKPDNCHYVEFGPGRGTLAGDALRAIAKFGFEPNIHLVETSPALREKQAALLPKAVFHDDMQTLPEDGPLLIVANEFFDALPVHQIMSTHAGWRERVVARDGQKFMALPGSRPMDNIVPEQFMRAAPGTILESNPASSAIAGEIARRISAQGGAALTIDYGYSEAQTGSTLQAVAGHEKVDVFTNPGDIDLTAHVNFADLAETARVQGVHVHGPTTQGTWLKNLGIEARAAALAAKQPAAKTDIDSALRRLTSDEEMGTLFKVLAFTAKTWPQAEGFGG